MNSINKKKNVLLLDFGDNDDHSHDDDDSD